MFRTKSNALVEDRAHPSWWDCSQWKRAIARLCFVLIDLGDRLLDTVMRGKCRNFTAVYRF